MRAKDGSPAVQARVNIRPPGASPPAIGAREAMTDAFGIARFEPIAKGEYVVQATIPSIEVRESDPTRVEPGAESRTKIDASSNRPR